MRVTPRDVTVLRDLSLSHALSRDQIIALGYFCSVTRANTRVRELIGAGLINRLSTPFFSQSIYVASVKASDIVGTRISPLLARRSPAPRFLQHALTVTDSRIALCRVTGGTWRFEQQLWRVIPAGERRELRPDGLLLGSCATFVEVDMGNVALPKFLAKLRAYRDLSHTCLCQDLYGFADFQLLTLTTGALRARHLRHITPRDAGFEHRVQTLGDIGVVPLNSWS